MKKYVYIIICLALVGSSSPAIAEPKTSTKEIGDLFVQIITLQGQQKYVEAILKCDEIISKDSQNATAYSMRASSFSSLGNHQRAIVDYGKAIEINSKELSYYQLRAWEYVYLGSNQRAIEDFNNAIEIDPNDAESYGSRGYVYGLVKDYKRAIQDYNKAIEMNPKEVIPNEKGLEIFPFPKDQFRPIVRSSYYTGRGSAYLGLGDYQKAADDFSKAIELNPGNALNYASRGDAYSSLKYYRLAVQEYEKAIELNPKLPGLDSVYVRCGDSYLKMNEISLAIRSFTKAIETNPNNAEAYRYRGYAHSLSGDERQSTEDLKEAERLGDEVAKEFLEKQSKIFRLVCHMEKLSDLSLVVNLAENTVNGFAAKITEGQIYWTQSDLWFVINRYTGQISSGLVGKGMRPFLGKCIKASEKQF